MLMLISLAFALRHKHNISTRRTNNVRSSCAYVMLMSWVFSLAYASVCAYAYACAYALVKTSLIRANNQRGVKAELTITHRKRGGVV